MFGDATWSWGFHVLHLFLSFSLLFHTFSVLRVEWILFALLLAICLSSYLPVFPLPKLDDQGMEFHGNLYMYDHSGVVLME